MIVRKATMRDIPPMLALINGYAAGGIMLPRTEFEMAENIRDFTVAASSDGPLLACGALHFYTPMTGEVRSIAVDPAAKGKGIGRDLLQAIENEARVCELHSLFAFTYVPDFFLKLGYTHVDRSQLPLKAWKDCMRCPKFQCCDEIAMVKHLDAGPASLGPVAEKPDELVNVQLPVLGPPDARQPIPPKAHV
jgi:amino-acid N-acetyltransferase